ncbi:MAG: ankyrin repeat domain-containing protein [Armatimonadetes bacterium]|nr:ankyrin repeat domain-containing protein [Armatimonadota bacterium]
MKTLTAVLAAGACLVLFVGCPVLAATPSAAQANQFRKAVASGDSVKTARLLKTNRRLANARNGDGYTPLMVAVGKGRLSLVKLLVSNGAQVNAIKKEPGWTPLHFAAAMGWKDIVNYLLSRGATADVQDEDGFTPLHTAATSGKLVRKDVKRTDWGFLERALELKWALTLSRVCPGKLSDRHPGADHAGAAQALLRNGASVNSAGTGVFGFTPLHIAAMYDALGVAKVLLSAGADLSAATRSVTGGLGARPVDYACSDPMRALLRDAETANRSAAAAEMASFAAVAAESVSTAKKPPATLLGAALSGDAERVRKLAESDPKLVNAADLKGTTPLHNAAGMGNKEIAEYLISKGAKINVPDKSGYTPLHCAVINGEAEMVSFLISKGANINANTKDGSTPLKIAIDFEKEAVAQLLRDKGAKE